MAHDTITLPDAPPIRTASYRLVGYVLTARLNNTAEWLDGLVDELNDWAAHVGDPDRVARHRDGLTIIRPTAATPENSEKNNRTSSPAAGDTQ